MAERLSDLIMRRTENRNPDLPSPKVLETSATFMAKENGWDPARTYHERENVWAAFEIQNKNAYDNVTE
jgi:hypothetical protein